MRHLLVGFILLSGFVGGGCRTVKPFEKEYLLSPIMDDEEVGHLTMRFAPKMYAKFERLSASGAGAAGTSCPTCGG